jgi:hypothetical protein
MGYNPFKTYGIEDDEEELKKAAADQALDQPDAAPVPSTPEPVKTDSNPVFKAMQLPNSDAGPAAINTFKSDTLAPVGLAAASMADQPSSSRVNQLTEQLRNQTKPMSTGKKIGMTLASMIPFAGPAYVGLSSAMDRRQINETKDELDAARGQQTSEFNNDAALRRTMLQESDQSQRSARDIAERMRTHTAMTYDPQSGLPTTYQYNPDSGHYDTPMGSAKAPTAQFQIQRHPTTNQPIGIQRRNGEVVYDPTKFTPEEKTAFDADTAAFGTGVENQRHLVKMKTDAEIERSRIAAQRASNLAAQHGDMAASKQVIGDYGDAMTAHSRASIMHELLPKAENGDAQADLALLANHLGMTMAQLRGARMNQALINEAARARGLGNGDREVGWFQHLNSGSLLAPEQRKQMVDLADETETTAWQKADDSATLYGVEPPKGRGKVGPAAKGNPIVNGVSSGNTPNGSSNPPNPISQGAQQDPKIGKTMWSKSLKKNVKITGKNPDGTYTYDEAQ